MADGFSFMKFCNEQTHDEVEKTIAMGVIRHLFQLDQLSLQKLADRCYTSAPTLSRFFQKAGFASYRAFRQEMTRFFNDMNLHRKLAAQRIYPQKDLSGVINRCHEQALANLQGTLDSLDIAEAAAFCRRCLQARTVIIIGDSHELNDFYTFQLDLLMHGVPVLLLNIHQLNQQTVRLLQAGDLVLFVSVFSGWFLPVHRELFLQIRQRGAQVDILAQEKEPFTDLADHLSTYGLPFSVNDGYYSLPLISRIFSDLFHLLS